MQLSQIKRLLNEYEGSWSLRKLFLKEEESISLIRQFLQKYETMPDDYELTTTDIYNLIKIILVKSNNSLIISLQRLFDMNFLLDIFRAINHANMLTEITFETIYLKTGSSLSLLSYLLSLLEDYQIELNAEMLSTVLKITSVDYTENEIRKCLQILVEADGFNFVGLNFLARRMEQAYGLLPLLQELQAANCLTAANIEALNSVHNIAFIIEILKCLRLAKINVTTGLLSLICANKVINQLSKILAILISVNPILLSAEIFNMLLERDFDFLFHKRSILKVCQTQEILDHRLLLNIFNHESYLVESIIQLLADGQLLKANLDLIDKLLHGEINCDRTHKALTYLIAAKVLDQNLLSACITALIPHENKSNCDFLNLFAIFTSHKVYLSKAELMTIVNTTRKFDRLYKVIVMLAAAHKLDQTAVNKVVERINKKYPKVAETMINKNRRKETGESRSEIIVHRGAGFFVEHDKAYLRGGKGFVKKVYATATSDNPLYAMKKPRDSGIFNANDELKREAKHHWLLGRESFYFTSSKKDVCVVTPWFSGKDLFLYSREEFMLLSFKVRLQCLASGLAELDILHQSYRMHGDIKGSNFIVDIDRAVMKLIDFGSVQKPGSRRHAARTFIDPYSYEHTFSSDVYLMGIVTMEFFPELYEITFRKPVAFEKVKSQFSPEEQAIVNLVDSMMHSNPRSRCTVSEALFYCNRLVEHIGPLSLEQLKLIVEATIHNTEPDVEAILRGCDKTVRRSLINRN